MDLFTHVLIGYLLAFGATGFQPGYLAAGALAGGLPDGDIAFFPIARKYPIFRHHGITHSIFGVTVVALVGAWLAPMVIPGSSLVYFAVMELGGLGHIAADAFTHFSVAPLLPFSKRPVELDADRAISALTLAVSVGALALLSVERFRVPFWAYLSSVWGLTAFYAIYFAIRLVGRYQIHKVQRSMPEFKTVIPTANPLRWTLLYERRVDGRLRTGYVEYRLGSGIRGPERRLDVPLEPTSTSGPVTTPEEALARSYPIARRESSILDETYHTGTAERRPEGSWHVVWYSLEFAAFGRAASVNVDIDSSGTMHAKRGWTALRHLPAVA